MADLIAERLTGVPADRFQNAAMQRGSETEPEARMAYEFRHDVEVRQVGLVPHPKITGTHASPDGFVGEDGLVEIKCPNVGTHLATLLGEPIPSKYIIQCQWQMACSGRAWCDWASYDNRLPENMRLFVQRIPRDPAMIADLERHVREFLVELDTKLAALTARYGTTDRRAA
jgi:putative phage-type endonuclease